MIKQGSNKSCLSIDFATLILAHFISILAGFTILTFISLNIGLSFNNFKILILVLIILTFPPFLIAYFNLKVVTIRDSKVLIILIVAGFLCATIAVFSHRFSGDDYIYTPNIVYSIDHPEEPMGYEVKFVYVGEDCEPSMLRLGAYEYSQGAIAELLGLEFLSVYYFLFPALVSFLFPFALYFSLINFSENTLNLAIGVIITIGVVLLLGETKQSYGNYSIFRAYQGKTFFLALGIPIFTGATLRFFNNPSRMNWFFLFGTSTAIIGASSSAIPILSSLALVLGIAHFLHQGIKWDKVPLYISYFSSLLFVVVYALFLLTNSAASDYGINSPVNAAWPMTFWGQLNLMTDKSKPITPIIVALSTIGGLVFSSKEQRRFLMIWVIAIITIFLNPVVAPTIMKYLTSANIYWRLFYVFPFPLVLGICATNLVSKARLLTQKSLVALTALTALALVGAHLLPFLPSAFRYNTSFKYPPEYNLPPQADIAREVIAESPDGPMLVSRKLAGMIPMMSSSHPQMYNWYTSFDLWLSKCGKADIAEIRRGAEEFVGGKKKYYSDFKTLLALEGDLIGSIVIDEKVMDVDGLPELLEKYAFVNQINVENFVIFWKQPQR